MGSKSSKQSSQDSHPLQSIPVPPGNFGQFPASFAIYFGGKIPESKDEAFFLTGESPETGQLWPLNIVVVHKGMRVKHQFTLHSGPKRDSLPLALGGGEKAFHSTSVIALPAYADGYSGGHGNQLVRMKDMKTFKTESFTFDLMVGQAGQQQKMETFEWTSNNLMKPERGKPLQRELVRLKSSGEREVVGTWVTELNPGDSSRLGGFHLQGSGATGELGPCWTLMAVVSLVRLTQMKWEAEIASDHMIRGAAKLAGFGVGFVL